MIMAYMVQTPALGTIVARIDVPPTMMAKTKMLTMTKMTAMTKKLPGTCQGDYKAMGIVVGLVFVGLVRETTRQWGLLLVWCLAGCSFITACALDVSRYKEEEEKMHVSALHGKSF
jgi:hypothetical protein